METKRRHRFLTQDERQLILRRWVRGDKWRDIAAEVGVSTRTMSDVLRPYGGVVRREVLRSSDGRLSLDDRVEIRLGLQQQLTYEQIGERIGRDKSTVCREVNRNGGRGSYQPMAAQRRAWHCSRRPKPTKLSCNEALRHEVEEGLLKRWSPQQIARRLKHEFRDDPLMQISHETIYKSLYVQGRGELRKELARCLRSGRAARVPHARTARSQGRIPDMVMISERPAEIEDRAVPGHWEGDLILGRNNNSAVGTLVERSTRFVMLLHLDGDKTAESVRQKMTAKIQTLPEALRRSITWDQGKEMAQHAQFTIDTGVQIYFCDPHSPWQRGSNENTNGLLRQFMPKGTDLSQHTPADLDHYADLLNGRPRQTLEWLTPSEKLNELLVAVTG